MKDFSDKVSRCLQRTGSLSFPSFESNEFSLIGLKILAAVRGSSSLPVLDTDNEPTSLVLCENSQWVFCSLLFICKRYCSGIVSQDNWLIMV